MKRSYRTIKRLIILATSLAFAGTASAQLTGVKNIPGDYPTLALAITDLNTQGVGAGGVTINLIAGNPQTAPAGGYIITASGTPANQININGNSNVITASNALTVGAVNDGIFKIIGGDFVNLLQFIMQENPLNTTTSVASNNMTEWGVALLYASNTNGAQNNTIAGNAISLNITYQNAIGIYSNVRHDANNVTTLADITNNTTAPNSNNKVYTNTISNVNAGIIFIGSAVAANMDMTNDIGGTSAITGNNINNYGGLAVGTAYVGLPLTVVLGVYLNDEINFNLSFNSIISASLNTATALRGILTDYAALPTGSIIDNCNSNTMTFTQAGIGGLQCITTACGAGTASNVTMNLNSNIIINNAVTGAASAVTIFGVANLGAFGTVNLNNNIIRNNTSTATTGSFVAVTNQGAATSAININNNQVGNSSGGAVTFSVGTSATLSPILNTAAASTATLTINGNSVQGISMVTGPLSVISNSAAAGTINITNNLLGTTSGDLVTFSAANSSAFTGISNTGGSTTTTTTISANDIRRIVYSAASSASNTYITATGTPISNTISNNTFTNLNVNTSGTCLFINQGYTIPNAGLCLISGNSIVTAYNRGGVSGSTTITTTNSTSGTGSTNNYINNNFSNITVTGTSTITGFNNTDGGTGSTKTITGNIFNNWIAGTGTINAMNFTYWNGVSSLSSNTITNITGQGSVTGITIGATSNAATSVAVASNIINNLTSTGVGGNVTGITCTNSSTLININNNVINTLSSTGASTVVAITIGGAATTNVFKNKIYDLSSNNAGASVFGLRITSGTTITASNNLIGDLRAPNANAANPIIGLNVTGGTTVNAYYNTIHLNATSVGATFGTSGISVSTGTTVDLRNNLVVNLSSFTGTGLTVAYRRSSTTLTSYVTASNNNSFYAGVPSASNLIFYDGTNSIQTLAAYQTFVAPRDNGTVSQNPAFTSIVGSSAGFLHIPAATTTPLESGGTVIGSITTDYDNDARPGPVGSVNGGATAPDIGADEFDGFLVLCSGAVGGTISPTTVTVCSGTTTVMSSVGATTGPGITYQWKVGTTSSGPYSNVVGGSGATTTTYTTGALTTGTFYYVLQVTCSAGPVTALSNELTVTVNPSPTVTVTPTSGLICLPGGSPVTLTASGGTTYTWLPTTGLTPTTGAVVSANPTTTITYTVTGTSGGCTGTATSVITVAPTPTVTVTATPSTVCSGGSSQLLATAVIPATSYVVTSIPYVPIAGVGPQATTGDDAVSGAITLPFSFTFYGIAYTQAFVYTNGFIQLGTSSGSTTTYGKDLTTTGAPNTVIGGVWTDLNSTAANQITTYVTGSSPNRVFTVYYNNVGFYDFNFTPAASGSVNFQIQLYEGSNIVEVHVGNTTGVSTTTANKTLGIENSTGTFNAFPAGHNLANWSAPTAQAWRFTPNTGSYTYLWSPGTFLNNTTISNPLATAITASTTYTALVTEASGCSASGTVTITAGSPLTSTSSASPSNTVCAGTNVTLNVTPTGGGAPYTYSWTGPNSFISTAQNPVITSATTAATGNYIVTVTDACGANSTTTVVLTVNPLPVVTVSPTSALYCNPSPAIALTASGATTYAWGPAAGLSATTGSTVNATPTITTTYTVTGTDGNGCIATATTAITSAPAVTGAVAAATPSTICAGSTTNLTSSANPITGTVFSENFNTGAPTWTRTNNSIGGTIANAAWTDRPDGFVYAAGTPYHTNDNSQFVQTNSDAQGSAATATRTTIQSPAFSTMGYTSMNLDFYQYYRDIASTDSAVVETSLNGINWTILTAFTTSSGSEAAFTHPTVALPVALENQPTVYVRFRYTTPGWDWYWSIDNVTITGLSPNYTYSWTSTPVGFTSTTQNPTGVAPTASSTYTVQITNAFGCSATATTGVTVNPLPTVVANSTAAAVCAGSTVTLTGSGATSYTWDNSVMDGVAFTPASTLSYIVMGTDANGCMNSDTIMVTVNPLPTVVANSTASTVCAGTTVTLTGSGATSYTWDNSVMDGVAFTPVSTLNYIVMGTDGNGCMNSDTIMVTVNPLPAVVANSTAAAVCAGSSVTLTGSGATSYTWDNSVMDGVAFTPVSTLNYIVMGTDANGCMNSDTIMVTVNALPTVVANSTAAAVCTGSTVTLTGSGATSYTWDNSVMDGVAFTPASTLSYIVMGTDANGCMNSDTIMVTVNALPTVVANSTAAAVCAGSSVTLTGSGATSYTWDNSVMDGVAFTPASTLSYIVMGTDVNGCMNSDTIMVAVNALPTVALGADITQCGGTVTLDAQNAGSTYLWNTTATTQTITVSTTGSYSVMVTDGNGCANSDTAVVTINTPPTVTGTATSTTVCVDDAAVALTGSPVGGTWTGPGVTGSSFTPMTAGLGAQTTIYNFTDVNGCTGTASVVITVNACVGVTEQTFDNGINVYPNPNNGTFTLSVNASVGDLVIVITDMQGRVVYSSLENDVQTGFAKQINLETASSGLYLMHITANGQQRTEKISVQK